MVRDPSYRYMKILSHSFHGGILRLPSCLSCLLALFLSIAIVLPAARSESNGHIAGKITDASDRSSLWGATVYIGGTTIGTVSDADGKYRLSSIKPGRVKIHFRYLGYRPDSAEVDVVSWETQKVDMAMHPDEIVGQEVVVTAQLQGQNAHAGAIQPVSSPRHKPNRR